MFLFHTKDIINAKLLFAVLADKAVGIKNKNIGKYANNANAQCQDCPQCCGPRDPIQSRISTQEIYHIKQCCRHHS